MIGPVVILKALRFERDEDEAAFRVERLAAIRPAMRYGVVVTLVLWIGATALIPLVARQHALPAMALAAAQLAATLIALPLIWRPRSFERATWLMVAGNASFGLVSLALHVIIGTFDDHAAMVTIVVLTFGLLVNGVAPRPALAGAGSYVAAFTVLRLVHGQAGPGRRAYELITLYAMLAVAVLIARFLEQSARDLFAQRQVIEQQRRSLEAEQRKSERLLLGLFPAAIAAQLKDRDVAIAESYEEATVLFADLVGFTPLAARLSAAEVVALLDAIFARFDALVAERGLEKIKTIGDAYMVVGGVPAARADHAAAIVDLGLALLSAIREEGSARGLPLDLRIGVHTGPVVAGVIGRRKPSYDLWGATVNLASRLESHGLAGTIHLSSETRRALPGGGSAESRGVVELKGIGPIETHVIRPGEAGGW